MKQNILKGNKLIAEFMGGKFFKDTEMILEIKVLNPTTGNYISCADKLQYHSSWNWLMPVVEKIARCQTADEEVIYNGEDSYFDAYYPRTFGMINSTTKEYMVRINRFPLHQSKSLIEATWFAVVEFVESYNVQPIEKPQCGVGEKNRN